MKTTIYSIATYSLINLLSPERLIDMRLREQLQDEKQQVEADYC